MTFWPTTVPSVSAASAVGELFWRFLEEEAEEEEVAVARPDSVCCGVWCSLLLWAPVPGALAISSWPDELAVGAARLREACEECACWCCWWREASDRGTVPSSSASSPATSPSLLTLLVLLVRGAGTATPSSIVPGKWRGRRRAWAQNFARVLSHPVPEPEVERWRVVAPRLSGVVMWRLNTQTRCVAACHWLFSSCPAFGQQFPGVPCPEVQMRSYSTGEILTVPEIPSARPAG